MPFAGCDLRLSATTSSNPGGGNIAYGLANDKTNLIPDNSNISYMVSDMGLTPEYWGPYVWASIHLICLGAPETLDAAQQQAYRNFFQQLPYVIPCSTCAQHLQENLAKVSIENSLAGRDDLFAWSVRLHNLVNQQLKKPTLELADAKKHWESVCSVVSHDSVVCASRSFSSVVQKIWIVMIGFLIGLAFMSGYQILFRKGRRNH